MKQLFTSVLLTLIVMPSFAQIQMEYDNGAKFQQVIDVDSASASDLYKAVERWITKTYRNPEKVVKARLENEEIRGEGFSEKAIILSVFPSAKSNLTYAFKIEVKNNRIRYTMYDMRGEMYAADTYIYKKDGTEKSNVQATHVKNSITEVAAFLIASLESSLKNKQGGDW